MQAADDHRPVPLGPLSAEIELALDEERRHIAAEIHDEVNVAMLAIRTRANSIAIQAASAGHAGIEKAAHQLVEAAKLAYDGMRRISRGLRPEALEVLGLGDAIRAMVSDFDAMHSGCRFELELAVHDPASAPKVEMTAYRVAQEALSNSVKHAHASLVKVTLEAEPAPRHLRLTIADNGQGFDPKQVASGGLGVAGMRDRVAACGGQLTLDSDSAGTRITVLL